MTIIKRDLEVVFYEHHTGEAMESRVLVSIGGGRADTWVTLQEFCELMSECQKEIRRRHWGEEQSANSAAQNNVTAPGA
jgi:hypothetical protein